MYCYVCTSLVGCGWATTRLGIDSGTGRHRLLAWRCGSCMGWRSPTLQIDWTIRGVQQVQRPEGLARLSDRIADGQRRQRGGLGWAEARKPRRGCGRGEARRARGSLLKGRQQVMLDEQGGREGGRGRQRHDGREAVKPIDGGAWSGWRALEAQS